MQRGEVLQIRLSTEEKQQIHEHAELARMKPAAYVRSMALHRPDSHNEILDPPQPSANPKSVDDLDEPPRFTPVPPVRAEAVTAQKVRHHQSQGKTKPHAERLAREELRL